MFAGEATSRKPGSVLGALLSGQREALRLQHLLGLSSGGGDGVGGHMNGSV
jgi:hypothetical protein